MAHSEEDKQKAIEALKEAATMFGTMHRLSIKAGVAPSRMYEVLAGKRNISPTIALRLEKATEGKVTRHQLCPNCSWELYP